MLNDPLGVYSIAQSMIGSLESNVLAGSGVFCGLSEAVPCACGSGTMVPVMASVLPALRSASRCSRPCSAWPEEGDLTSKFVKCLIESVSVTTLWLDDMV